MRGRAVVSTRPDMWQPVPKLATSCAPDNVLALAGPLAERKGQLMHVCPFCAWQDLHRDADGSEPPTSVFSPGGVGWPSSLGAFFQAAATMHEHSHARMLTHTSCHSFMSAFMHVHACVFQLLFHACMHACMHGRVHACPRLIVHVRVHASPLIFHS